MGRQGRSSSMGVALRAESKLEVLRVLVLVVGWRRDGRVAIERVKLVVI
jgi:hypothetical protein